MHWTYVAGVGILALSVAVLYQKRAMSEEDSDPVAGAIVFQYLLTLATGAYALLVGMRWPALALWPYFCFRQFFMGWEQCYSFGQSRRLRPAR